MTLKSSPITFNGATKVDELDDSIVLFDEPLQIVGTNERQWNGTIYDLNSTDVTQWDGIITQNHESKLADVIGKAIGLTKNKQGVFIRGIKYATNITPVAVLAKNLLLEGFAPGFSCETLGPDPDENGVWKNHALCGLSQVVHPNDKMAYAVVTNSLEEAEENGLDTSSLKNEVESWKNDLEITINSNEDSKRLNDLNVSEEETEDTQDNSVVYDRLGRKILDTSEENNYNSIMKIIGYDLLGRPILNGGKGSGNFGHSGRPGLQGGSAGSGSSTTKSTSKKGSKSDSQTMTKDQKAKLAEVGKELGMTISVFEDAYNDASKRLGEIEQDYATEYDDDSYDEFGRWKETDIDDYGDPELSKAESLAEDLEDLSEGLKRIKSKYDSAMSKDYLSKDQMGKFLEDAYKTVEKYQDEYDSEMNISGIVIHVAEELYIVKTTIKKAQESLKAEKDSKN